MIPKIFDRLFFFGPVSLGDTFVLSGAAHYFGDRCNELHFPCHEKFFETTSTLFQDYPNIKVVVMNGDIPTYLKEHGISRVLQNEIHMETIDGVSVIPMWDRQLYYGLDLPFSLRYTNFRLPKYVYGADHLYRSLSSGEPYVLVHKRTSDHPDGIPISITGFRESYNLPTDLKIIEITESITSNMMQYVKLIEHATEIHCVSSSFFNLVDSMNNITNARLFFHDARATCRMSLHKRWTRVMYNNKC